MFTKRFNVKFLRSKWIIRRAPRLHLFRRWNNELLQARYRTIKWSLKSGQINQFTRDHAWKCSNQFLIIAQLNGTHTKKRPVIGRYMRKSALNNTWNAFVVWLCVYGCVRVSLCVFAWGWDSCQKIFALWFPSFVRSMVHALTISDLALCAGCFVGTDFFFNSTFTRFNS